MDQVTVYCDDRLGEYNFGADHPFGPQRYPAFVQKFQALKLDKQCRLQRSRLAPREAIECFHTPAYVERVLRASASGHGSLDGGDTPVFPGVYEAAARVVGTVLHAVAELVAGTTRRAFVPIAGLHHARRDAAAGFCVFNDCGVAIETLRREHGIRRIAYVDIDAHHGDGVYYAFESDPDLAIVDIHEDGRYLYPGTGRVDETGSGAARGTKLNVPLPPGAGDRVLFEAWAACESFIDRAKPECIILQCGADSLAGDPITDLAFSSEAHRHVTDRLCDLAERHCQGRLLALGGGGYKLDNLADAWCAVVTAMVEHTARQALDAQPQSDR
jgi:acetoin utilization protein AcuC